MMVTKRYHATLSYNGLIQKWWVYALKLHYKLEIMTYLWLFIRGGWIKCNAHICTIVCYSYYNFCCMMMNEQMTNRKHKSNHIGHKSFLYCASKPDTKKMLKKNYIFQFKDVNNVNIKNNLSMQTYHPWIISKLWYFDIASIFLFDYT